MTRQVDHDNSLFPRPRMRDFRPAVLAGVMCVLRGALILREERTNCAGIHRALTLPLRGRVDRWSEA